MNLKLDSAFVGWSLAGVLIVLAVISASVGTASARSGGFELFLARLALPVGLGILIISATVTLKVVLNRQGAAERTTLTDDQDRVREEARTAAPSRAEKEGQNIVLERGMLRAASLVTGILGSLFNLGIGLFLIIVAVAVRDIADEFGFVADATDLDDIIVWVLVGLGVILVMISGLGILGASLAMKKPGAALILLSIVAGINALIFVLTLFGGEWRSILLYLISTVLLTASAVCAFKGREELN